MPRKNVVKQYHPDSFYHIYSRGVAKQSIFKDSTDYLVFINLFGRYLSKKPVQNSARMQYPWLRQEIDLLAYCLMPNHIHILVYQHNQRGITNLMRALFTSYGMYFNKRYKRVGPIFQSSYLAKRIDQDNYLDHISRYIHLNPKGWRHYPYSSIGQYLSPKEEDWLDISRILSLFNSKRDYEKFLHDYEAQKEILDELKWELANES
jgi:putative transposase